MMRLVPVGGGEPRRLGLYAGKLHESDDAWDPMTDEELLLREGDR